ncbi:hypothetical protein HK097_006461 [Rhizophlyctis rosea]|uniref:Uncharacterized protein n=1 Tax=Rhizophlyctis rosea TaxID=64517 RepID=A0AAD5X5R3_9FUNG|nr:hypothetical protein HK097_006461 [Rhizophlyctis rosea]
MSTTKAAPPAGAPAPANSFESPFSFAQPLFDFSARLSNIPRKAFFIILPAYLALYYHVSSIQSEVDVLQKNYDYKAPEDATTLEGFLGRLGADGRSLYHSLLIKEFPAVALMALLVTMTISAITVPLVDSEAELANQTLPPPGVRRPMYPGGFPPTLINLLPIPGFILSVIYNIFLMNVINEFDASTGRSTSTRVETAMNLGLFRSNMIQFVLLLAGMAVASGWGRVISHRLKVGRPVLGGKGKEGEEGAGAAGADGRPPIPGLSRVGDLSQKTWKQMRDERTQLKKNKKAA